MKKPLYKGLSFLSLILFSASMVFAQKETNYDPYAPILKYPRAQDPAQAEKHERDIFIARLLEQPLRPIGYGLGETAE